MRCKAKLMYLGINHISSKDGNNYNILGLLDPDSQSVYKLYINDKVIEKYNDYKLYNMYDFDLVISKNEKSGQIMVGVV